jgi:3',5'-cyclic AMP phosphodiesterase CpdA
MFLASTFFYSCIGQETTSMIKQQETTIPAVYSNIFTDASGKLYIEVGGVKYYKSETPPWYSLEKMMGNPQGKPNGIQFDFDNPKFKGKLVYGLIPFGDSKHPYPVYLYASAKIEEGKCFVDIQDRLDGRYDMTGWEKSGKGTLGYRVISKTGQFYYDGQISFIAGPVFGIDTTLVEGPFINLLEPEGATISFKTNVKTVCHVKAGGKTFSDKEATYQHEIKVSGLRPNSAYDYEVLYGSNRQNYSFKTAPKEGSRTQFSFGYASDSRAGNGGGERTFIGVNHYIVKKIMALANQQNVAFCQFTGDLVSGYSKHRTEIDLEYTNWKQAIAPFAHYFPVVTAMGNHEALIDIFEKEGVRKRFRIDQFPFETRSAEVAFAENFVNPTNGPISEDNSIYDPNKNTIDFPSYDENVFYYIYDNLAMIVLNSDYFYAPSISGSPQSSGNLHGYLMDNQIKWLENTIAQLEKNKDIDHIIVTQHTPAFPNGGHVGDDMWYRGNNKYRPYVAGKPVEKGIIERRDEYLDILVNKSKKVIAILTGDEHNYCRTEIGPNTTIYNEDYPEDKRIKLSRTIYQINNGAAGAPYYAQEQTPWSEYVGGFTTQNALVIMYVDGLSLKMKVLNPDTLEEVDKLELRK